MRAIYTRALGDWFNVRFCGVSSRGGKHVSARMPIRLAAHSNVLEKYNSDWCTKFIMGAMFYSLLKNSGDF